MKFASDFFGGIGDFVTDISDVFSPTLNAGIEGYFTSKVEEERARAIVAQSNASNSKTYWLIGGGVALIAIVAIIVARR